MSKCRITDLPKVQNTNVRYSYDSRCVNGLMLAEACEQAYTGTDVVLVSMDKGCPSPVLQVSRDGVAMDIHNFFKSEKLTQYLQKRGFIPCYYDRERMRVRPNDSMTILCDTSLFVPTLLGNKGNRLYERKGTDELWCLDRGHRGASVHLEVFNRNTGYQIHVSEVDKIHFFRELTAKEKKRKCDKDPMP